MFERAIPSSSTQNVLTQYLSRITEYARKKNVLESDYISFDFLLRAPYLRYASSRDIVY